MHVTRFIRMDAVVRAQAERAAVDADVCERSERAKVARTGAGQKGRVSDFDEREETLHNVKGNVLG